MKFSILGLNHKTAPLAVREKVAFPDTALPDSLLQLRGHQGLQEALILSTCNRVEIMLTAEDHADPRVEIERFLSLSHAIEQHEVAPHLYHLEGTEAIRHLFRVASSLDSMVVGEPQILGQLKSAYTAARTHGLVTSLLDGLVTRAFSVAKRVRSETDIGQSAVSVSFAAVELARDIFGSLKNCKVLVIGAGEMAELALRHFRRQGIAELLVTNRTFAKADELAHEFNGRAVEYASFLDVLPQVDIVVASSGAPHFILDKPQMKRIIELRKNRPMFLIDIAVPRNIDPSVQQLDHCFLYDVDDLQRVVDQNLKVRQSEAEHAESIITEEVERVGQWLKTREIAPLIRGLQEHFETVRAAEIERMRGRLSSFTPEQQELVDSITRSLVNKLAHGPMVELRRLAAAPDAEEPLDLIKRMFKLSPNNHSR